MANQKLTETLCKELPTGGIYFDSEVHGLGLRVTNAGARAWVLDYRSGRRQRRITIGSFPDWKVPAAREEAKKLKRLVDQGRDPMEERHADRAAPTVAELAARFEAEHVIRKRAPTQRDYKSILRLYVRPALGTTRVAEVRHEDISRLHARVSKTAPYRANRTVAVCSVMFSFAIRCGMRLDNPATSVERTPENKRERYLTPAEMARLGGALAAHPERTSANAVRLLLLTGARKGETLAARWADIDLGAGVWTKPAATTKTAKLHRVPLSAPALELLAGMKAGADTENARRAKDGLPPIECVFPSAGGKPLGDIKHFWAAVCGNADLQGVRIHDLRHSFASVLVSSGLSLPIIGALLGHTQASTTQRYAHLADDPLRKATEIAGAIISGTKVAPG